MKLNYIFITLIFLFISTKSFAQKSFTEKFDYYEILVIMNGQEIERRILGTDCKLQFNLKKEIYYLTFTDRANRPSFSNLQVVKNDTNEIIVKAIGDISPKPLRIVKDSILTKQKIEFISKDIPEMVITYKLFNKKQENNTLID